MSPWYSAWLPGLPSLDFALPSNIQRRFISFFLKRCLGHFLKPGQLDVNQVDSQIGSGFVQVKDLELDNEAINKSLFGYPIRLVNGYVSAITVRIPWPNLFTSTLRLSLQSAHLTFHLTPAQSDASNVSAQNLADSMVSVAESFIHDELSEIEEAALRKSLHHDFASTPEDVHQLPGGLDPFITTSDDMEFSGDGNPAGVSIFATLIEQILAKFEFDVMDTKITLVYPEHASFTFSIQELLYKTEGSASSEEENANPAVVRLHGQTRMVSILGVDVTAQNLRSSGSMSPSTLFPDSPKLNLHVQLPPVSPASSSSSLDEGTQFLMSQSIVSLPPRPSSPQSSVGESMYQSAMSTVATSEHLSQLNVGIRSRTPSPESRRAETPCTETPRMQTLKLQAIHSIRDPEPETILSFGTEPITFRLTTPSPSESRASQFRTGSMAPPSPFSPTGFATPQAEAPDRLHLSVTCGVIACALNAWQVRSLLEILESWNSHHSPSDTLSSGPASTATSISGIELDVKIHVRGIVLILLPPKSATDLHSSDLDSYFSRPLVPPRLPHGYTRLHLETFSFSLESGASFGRPVKSTSPSARRPPQAEVASSITTALSVTLAEISIFAFQPQLPHTSGEIGLIASPILITDSQLPSQYPRGHIHPDPHNPSPHSSAKCPPMPVIDVSNWMESTHWSTSAKVSLWRTKPKPSASRQSAPSIPHLPAISVSATRCVSRTGVAKGQQSASCTFQGVDAKVLPLQIFVDLGLALGSGSVLSFLEDALPASLSGGQSAASQERHEDFAFEDSGNEGQTECHPASPSKERERERRRLEKLVLEDLDLEVDYGPKSEPLNSETSESLNVADSRERKARRRGREQQQALTIIFPLLRLQIRCPSSPSKSQRSGVLVLDLHEVRLSNGLPSNPKPSARFESSEIRTAPSRSRSGNVPLLSLSSQRIVVACSRVDERKTAANLSLGPLASGALTSSAPLDPRHLGTDSSSNTNDSHPPVSYLLLALSRRRPSNSASAPPGANLVLSANVPSVHVNLCKSALDSLQYWADDVAQLFERSFTAQGKDTDTETADSRDVSMIGSRFFAKSLRSKSSESWTIGRSDTGSEIVVKLVISEAFMRILLPRGDATETPLDISASDVDILCEFKPEGKDETVLTLGVMDLSLADTSCDGSSKTYLHLTPSRGLLSSPKSLLKLRFVSLVVPETSAKESRIRLTLCGFTYNLTPELAWVSEFGLFFKAPPGTFESMPPSERTKVYLKIVDGSIRATTLSHPGALVAHVGDLEFTTSIVGGASETSFRLAVSALALLVLDDITFDNLSSDKSPFSGPLEGPSYWKRVGYAMIAEVADLDMNYANCSVMNGPETVLIVEHAGLRLHLCADTMAVFIAFMGDLIAVFQPQTANQSPRPKRVPTTVSPPLPSKQGILSSIQEHAFQRVPEVGPAPDMIHDDLPTNLDYLDESFGTAAGLRELRDDDLDDFDVEDLLSFKRTSQITASQSGIISSIGGETIRILRPEGIHVTENYFDLLPHEAAQGKTELGETSLRVRMHKLDVSIHLYDGYDWARTRKAIEDKVKEMRKRLAKIRQLVASGQTHDQIIEEETSALLFNSVYIGLEQDVDGMEAGALIAAIDEELNDDPETASQSSWQSLRPAHAAKLPTRSTRIHGKRLNRAKMPSIEFRLMGVDAEMDRYRPNEPWVSRIFAVIKDVEILDHIKTSTWRKFLTELRSDSRGNVRETDSNMVRLELRSVRPVPGHPSEEARLRAKILPLRLYVDQDALDFMKKFFSFQDAQTDTSTDDASDEGIFFQLAEVFPIDIKLDYKPRRVDYRALREGRTIELMNFFHFDGAEMTLRHITMYGVSGWARFFDMLNDLWTPDVKATQLVDVISGVSPIRSVVNVGSGVADLILLPIAQYKKDGRIVRGVQKGTTAFFKSTAMEAIRLGARLATGTQVILEQAESVLGGQFKNPITTETLQSPSVMSDFGSGSEVGDEEEDGPSDLISKYAEQPGDVKEGVQTAYRSLQRNLHSAAQTILAVPMEVYEQSGNEGVVSAVIRAVPIAVLRPMIGASEAVSKTLMGLQNTLDPDIRRENEAKYKQR